MTGDDGSRLLTRMEAVERHFGKRDISDTPIRSDDYWKGIFDTLPDRLRQDGASFISLAKDVLLPVCEVLMLHDKAEPKAAELRGELEGFIHAVDRLIERVNALKPLLRHSLVNDGVPHSDTDHFDFLGEFLAVARRRAVNELENRPLASYLGDHGVAYEHERKLGNPKPLREWLKEGADWGDFEEVYRAHLETSSDDALLGVVDALHAGEVLCLLISASA